MHLTLKTLIRANYMVSTRDAEPRFAGIRTQHQLASPIRSRRLLRGYFAIGLGFAGWFCITQFLNPRTFNRDDLHSVLVAVAVAADDQPAVKTVNDAAKTVDRAAIRTQMQASAGKFRQAMINAQSQLGDAAFFAADFPAAVHAYEQMVHLDPGQDEGHWRKGIAYFYAGRHEEAASQFERYHQVDSVDRENGIWRFLSQVRFLGLETARKNLLAYKSGDREPFPDVYTMFQGELTGEQVLQRIAAAKIRDSERQSRLFYTHLYIGLLAAVQDDPAAIKSLLLAVDNPWPRAAGYGPQYMWQVARLHADVLEAEAAKKTNGVEGGTPTSK